MSFPHWLRFWGRHLVLLNLGLLALVWVLYGDLTLSSYGANYAERARNFWLQGEEGYFDDRPGIENVLLPGVAALIFTWELTDWAYALLSVVPYPLFICVVTRHISRHFRGGPVLAVGAAIGLYTSGMIPYMTSWGGYPDGAGYLLMAPVFIRPESLLVYVGAFTLQCLNHYLGALALVVFAFLWYSMRALERTDGAGAAKYWLTGFVPRLALSVILLAGFIWFWQTTSPTAAGVRQAIVLRKWVNPSLVLEEVLGWFPWTMLSTLKLGVVPIAVLMAAHSPRRAWRMMVLAAPFAAATVLTLIFVDVTRVATMLVMPALLVTIHAAGSTDTPPHLRRRLRRWLIATSLLNLLIPNYYVNNANIIVPPPRDTTDVIWTLVESLRK